MLVRELESKDKETVEAIFDLYWSGVFREKLSERLQQFLSNDLELQRKHFKFFVAENDGEVLGVAALRDAPEHIAQYAATSQPVEFYVVAVKERGRGIGTLLRNTRIEKARSGGYTEALFFSDETHKDSWPFHDNSGFKRVAETSAPDGERGYIWSLPL